MFILSSFSCSLPINFNVVCSLFFIWCRFSLYGLFSCFLHFVFWLILFLSFRFPSDMLLMLCRFMQFLFSARRRFYLYILLLWCNSSVTFKSCWGFFFPPPCCRHWFNLYRILSENVVFKNTKINKIDKILVFTVGIKIFPTLIKLP